MAASSVISDPKQAARELKRLFSEHERAVFFGGAGVSTASGIPDFRSVDGLYHQQFAYPPETHALAFVLREPSRGVLRLLPQKDDRPGRQAQPRAHEARRAGGRGQARCRCDPEHRRAAPDGRSNVVWELHGSVHRNICQRCGATYDAAWICAREHEDERGIPLCPACGGRIKPDVVLYEESLDSSVLTGAINAISHADMLVIGGTSLVVYPAAGLTQYFQGDTLVIINRDPTPQDRNADVLISCDIAQAFDF